MPSCCDHCGLTMLQVSMVLDFSTLSLPPVKHDTNFWPSVLSLPTYVAAALHHRKTHFLQAKEADGDDDGGSSYASFGDAVDQTDAMALKAFLAEVERYD